MKRIELNDTLRSLLYEIPLFKDLSDSEVKLLIEDLDYVVYAYEKGEEVIHQGDLCRSLCILLKGILQVDIIDANGDSVLIEHITAPRSFATSHLFQEDNRFPATFTRYVWKSTTRSKRLITSAGVSAKPQRYWVRKKNSRSISF
mgnify:CR=1 FL=1